MRGRRRVDGVDARAPARDLDLAPERAQRDERREPLRALDVELVDAGEIGLVPGGRDDLDRRQPLGIALERREPGLGDRPAVDEHVEVEDARAAGIAVRRLALHVDDRRGGVRVVGQQHERVGLVEGA